MTGQDRPWLLRLVLAASALLLLVAAASGCRTFGQPASEADTLVASGSLEADAVSLHPEIGGRIVEILVSEGQEIEAGTPIARLDRSIWLAQRAQAEAALISARSQLAQLAAGSRREAIAAAEADLKRAIAERDRAHRAWQYALATRGDPQTLNLQIAQAQAELAVAEEEIIQAEAQLAQRTVTRDQYHYPQRAWHLYNYLTIAGQEALMGAQAKRDGAAQHLVNLVDMRDRPLAQNAKLHAAQAVYQAAEGVVLQKQAALSEVEAGPSAEELDTARAQVALAEARLRTIDVTLQRAEVTAPIAGVVIDLPLQVGELASPGSPVAVLSNLDQMTLRVYVPEISLGRVYLGQEVRVQVDTFPGVAFVGHVVLIGSEAEFAPRSIESQDERVKMVFGVTIHLENQGHSLKPGLPVDAGFVEEGG